MRKLGSPNTMPTAAAHSPARIMLGMIPSHGRRSTKL
jgi:hypothetical protein